MHHPQQLPHIDGGGVHHFQTLNSTSEIAGCIEKKVSIELLMMVPGHGYPDSAVKPADAPTECRYSDLIMDILCFIKLTSQT